MNFSSVDDFLRQAKTVKEETIASIDDNLTPYFDDAGLVGVPPVFANSIATLVNQYGDETYRQIILFCMNQWHNYHAHVLRKQINNDCIQEGLSIMDDLSRLTTVLQLLQQTGSFSGDEQWLKMIKTTITHAMLEKLEKDNISLEDYLEQSK